MQGSLEIVFIAVQPRALLKFFYCKRKGEWRTEGTTVSLSHSLLLISPLKVQIPFLHTKAQPKEPHQNPRERIAHHPDGLGTGCNFGIVGLVKGGQFRERQFLLVWLIQLKTLKHKRKCLFPSLHQQKMVK